MDPVRSLTRELDDDVAGVVAGVDVVAEAALHAVGAAASVNVVVSCIAKEVVVAGTAV